MHMSGSVTARLLTTVAGGSGSECWLFKDLGVAVRIITLDLQDCGWTAVVRGPNLSKGPF